MSIRQITIGTRKGDLEIKMTQDYNEERYSGPYRYVIERLPKRHIVCVGRSFRVITGTIDLSDLEEAIERFKEKEH